MNEAATLEAPARTDLEEDVRQGAARLERARREFGRALDGLRDALYVDMRARLAAMDPAARDGWLRRQVKQASSGWSGGQNTETNLREAIAREVYLGQLTAGC